MVPIITGRGVPPARQGWETRLQAPLDRVRRTFEGRLPGLPGSAPIPFRPRPAPDASAGAREAPAPWGGPGLRIGSLEVRLAAGRSEIRRAQRLRYHVFYEEMSALPSGVARLRRRDADVFDARCDHLVVVDHAAATVGPLGRLRPKVVATTRLLRAERAAAGPGFYSAGEFALDGLLERQAGRRLLELGRSCVLAPYRTKRTVELLWAGIWAYARHHRIEAMFGCASLEGTDPDRLALPLSFLHHHARAPEAWRVRPLPGRRVAMDRLPREAVDPRAALRALPPLVKGYLRLGATFGDGAVVDHQFGTTDVFVVLPVEVIGARYREHFGEGLQAGLRAA